jgi:hypothetical protein
LRSTSTKLIPDSISYSGDEEKSVKMSAIKKFFEKKKTEAKFKLAGKGQKLGDADAAAQAQAARVASAQRSQSASGSSSGGPKNLSSQQRQAAEAALAR